MVARLAAAADVATQERADALRALQQRLDGEKQQALRSASEREARQEAELQSLRDASRARVVLVQKVVGQARSLGKACTDLSNVVGSSFSSLSRDVENWGGQLVARAREMAERQEALRSSAFNEAARRRAVFNQLQNLRGNIRVICRIRPLLPKERARGETECAAQRASNTQLHVCTTKAAASGATRRTKQTFAFSKVFGLGCQRAIDATCTRRALKGV